MGYRDDEDDTPFYVDRRNKPAVLPMIITLTICLLVFCVVLDFL